MTNDLISRAELRRSLMIWADKLRTAGECGGCEVELLQAVVKMVDAQAAVDAEPVRHGEWSGYRINGYDGLHPVYETQCSLCGKYARFTYRFCPHCGARMDGGNEDGHRHDHQ